MYLVHWLLAAALLVVATAAPSASDADVAWQNFKSSHGKQYRSLVEESLRKEIFVKNFNKVAAHNKLYEEGLVSYSLNINRFADLTSEEMKRMNGYRKNKVGARSIDTIQFVPDPNAQIPSEFDWREKGAVTDVKDQGACGSCWAFSSTGALEGQYFLKTGKLVSMSEQNLVDCSTSEGNAGCFGGDMYPAYAYVHKQDGLDSEASYPYEAVDSSCRYNVAGNVTSLKGFGSIEMGNEEHLKAAIATVGPIAVAIDASHNDFGLYSGGIYYNAQCYTANEDLDHAVLAVGYGTENGQDYWLVKNSWGTDWGEAGYIKMARNKDNNCGIATEGVYPLNY